MSTQLLREKDWVDFLVETGDPLYQGRLSRKLPAGGDVDRLRHAGVRWWLYGSGALAVRGVELEPGD